MAAVTEDVIPQDAAAHLQLAAFAGGRPDGMLLEARERLENGRMRSTFFDASDPSRASRRVQARGQARDVFVAVNPRRAGKLNACGRQSGGLDAIDSCWTLHVDCDTAEACAALETFQPAAAVIVRSGNGAHGYWPLRRPLSPEWAVRANRRLAHTLGGDSRACDAARIMRPAGTLNFKTDPPRPVVCVRLEIVAYVAADVVGPLPDPPLERPASLPARRMPSRAERADALLSIPAAEYVPALSGRPVGRDGKARCPWHAGGQERTPSLHAYASAEAGWWCYGCDRGGTIIDFGAALYGIAPRGASYGELRRRLAGDLLGAAEAA